jgi:hypothetical protein
MYEDFNRTVVFAGEALVASAGNNWPSNSQRETRLAARGESGPFHAAINPLTAIG